MDYMHAQLQRLHAHVREASPRLGNCGGWCFEAQSREPLESMPTLLAQALIKATWLQLLTREQGF
jgi:hypothetical protein